MKQTTTATSSTSEILAQMGSLVQELENRNVLATDQPLLDTAQALEAKTLAGRLEQLVQPLASPLNDTFDAPVMMASTILEHDKDTDKRG